MVSALVQEKTWSNLLIRVANNPNNFPWTKNLPEPAPTLLFSSDLFGQTFECNEENPYSIGAWLKLATNFETFETAHRPNDHQQHTAEPTKKDLLDIL